MTYVIGNSFATHLFLMHCYLEMKLSRSATPDTAKTTDIKPTNTIDPTNAAGLPPDLPAATDADAANAGLMAGVSGFSGRCGSV
jgi:hypothetical protein